MGLMEDIITIYFRIPLILEYFFWNLFTCLKSLKYFYAPFNINYLDELHFMKIKMAKK